MTFAWRFKVVLADKKGKKDIIDGGEFKNCHAAQLNDAEYAPIFIGVLLFLHSKQIEAPVTSTLAAVGCISYLWGKIYLPFPAQVPGATMRYLSLGFLTHELYKLMF